jgi:hypothetical protein
MKKHMARLLIGVSLVFAGLGGCGPGSAATPPSPTEGPPRVAPTNTPVLPTPTPEGNTITVTSPDDAGPGTLRQALEDAQPYDKIVFDTAVFPPDAAATIFVESALPQLTQGHLTIDASDAGVVLDGSQLPEDSWITGVDILSDGNTIRGLQIINFTGVGIVVTERARNNTIGGDRNTGVGPIGQGNLSSGNDFGIGIWTDSAGNVVTGNLIGTDPTGTGNLGNSASGVSITEGALDNTVGPNNIIAYNGRAGIEVERFESFHNVLTQNSIHDNGGRGILLFRGGNSMLAAPVILDFDLPGGTASGIACPNCTVEVYSDAAEEGMTYEGTALADDAGAFAFNRGSGFTNAQLTATATDADGNTSAFSHPAYVGGLPLALQEGNSGPASVLQPRPSNELADNRIGLSYAGAGLWGDRQDYDGVLAALVDVGATRIDSSLYELEYPIDWGTSEYEIPAEFDRLVSDLNKDGVEFDYMLHFWDKAGHPGGEGLSTPRFQNDQQIQDFLDYVHFVVGHFKGRIPYYTLWSESDNCGEGGIKCIRSADYANLAVQVIRAIHEEDPHAKVALGPVSSPFFARSYLFELLESDAIKDFDVVQWHGMYDVVPESSFFGNYYYDYPDIIQQIKDTASAHGFNGEYWGTEITWCSDEFPGCHPADQPWPAPKTDLLAAKYYARGIVLQLGMDVGVGIGGFQFAAPWSYPAIRNLSTLMAGAKPTDLSASIESDAFKIMSYGFVLPKQDQLFVFWSNSVASELDPGVSATLTIRAPASSSVSAIDVLNGFEQGLVADRDGGNLVIHDLLIKDYPIIVRLTH